MRVRIYQPARSAMQSGTARTKAWVLDFPPADPRSIDPLMGWTSSTDMMAQVRLNFPTKDEAIAYAERNGIAYRVEEPKPVKTVLQSYSDNFRSTRMGQWTH